MKKYLILFIILIISAGCTNRKSQAVLKVAVAGNMAYAIKEITETFQEQYPQIAITTTIASSGKLAAQISSGADYDLFLSADTARPQLLYEKKLAGTKPQIYARGELILFSVKKRNFSDGLNILHDPDIEKIVICEPKLAPYGKAALSLLVKTGLSDELLGKLVYAGNITQAVQYTITGAADAGFIARSALTADKLKEFDKENIYWFAPAPELYPPIEQAMVLLSDKEEALELFNFILSPQGQKILRKYGYK